jgi:hypothetical protein
VGRMLAIPRFLGDARRTLAPAVPAAWVARARRECEGAAVFFTQGLPRLLDEEAARLPGRLPARVRSAAEVARAAFARFDAWLAGDLGAAEADRYSAGPEFLDLLVTRGHLSDIGPPELLAWAREEFTEARARLHDMARAADPDGWPGVQEQLARRHPTVETYLPAYHRAWEACRQAAADHDLVTWEACPVRYGPIPRHTRDAAPFLYYLHYRSPAPFEMIGVYDYVVTPIDPEMSPDQQERLLRATNDSVIKLNHVVHHGAIGHHVQNHHASRSASRIGQVAAVDCASRIGMFSGGTLAEGWACYATDLMEETGFLTALERVAEQHSRVRQIGRMIVDIQLHSGTMSFEQAVAFYRDEVGMADSAARGEATRNSMFPGTALMYWLGIDAVHRLRRSRERADGAGFSLGRFHDRLLSFGAIPVPLIARLFTEESGIRNQESGVGGRIVTRRTGPS